MAEIEKVPGTRPLGYGIAQFIDRLASPGGGLPWLEARALGTPDEFGELWEVLFSSPIPPDSFAGFRIWPPGGGGNAKSAPPFAQEDGSFLFMTPIIANLALAYIPYAALRGCPPGPGRVAITVLSKAGGSFTKVGLTWFEQRLPAPVRWDWVEHLRPVMELFMALALADGELTQARVTAVRAACEEHFGFGEEHIDRFFSVLNEIHAKAVSVSDHEAVRIAKAFCVRFPRLRWTMSKPMLSVALADGTVHPRTAEVGRVMLTTLGHGVDEWTNLPLKATNTHEIHFVTLGLKPGATALQVKAQYHALVKQYHPDRYAEAPLEIKAVAEKKTIELRTAYEALLQAIG